MSKNESQKETGSLINREMKREITVIVIAIVFLTACAVRKSEPITQRQFNPKDNQVINGERVFMMHCQKCHPGGEAGLAPSIVSNPLPQFLKRFQVRHGLGVMPSFKADVLSKQDLDHLIAYIKAWKKY